MFKPSFINHQHDIPDAPRKSHAFLYTLLIVLVVGGGVVGLVLAIASFRQAPSEIIHTNTTLTPTSDKNGIFNSLKNFFFANNTSVFEGQNTNRVNILVLGVGGSGHDGSYLSDTNIIMSLKPSTGEVAMISIPRDLMVKFDNYGYQKINAVSSYSELRNPGQGGEKTRQFFAKQFNIDIPYYIRVDFQAFKDIIDAVDGIEVDVPVSFTDYRYPGPNYSYQTVSFNKGPTTLNGEQALVYSRSRHGNNGEGSDFARSRRQQQVMLALKQKLLSTGKLANPLVLKDIYDSLSNHVTTNLNFSQIINLAGLSQYVNKERIKNVVIDDNRHGLIIPFNNQLGSVLIPKSGNFDLINAFIANVFESASNTTALDTPNTIVSAIAPTDSLIKSPTSSTRISSTSAVIDIYNGTWEVGLAARVKKYLEGKGYFIRTVGNSSERPVTITSLYAANPHIDPGFLSTMAVDIPAKLGKSVPNWLTPSSTPTSSPSPTLPPADIIILVGTDFKIN